MSARLQKALGAILVLTSVFAAVYFAPTMRTTEFWQRFASPGPLSLAHSSLEGRCSGCHVAVQGVEPERCIVCHANETTLLQRQPTAFHANIGSCSACHREHEGMRELRPAMNHEVLARIGLRQLAGAPKDNEGLLYSHLLAHFATSGSASQKERLLDCFGCHQSRDRHVGQFGRDCSACHATDHWNIAEYRHPAPSSTDCAQCHRAPPSHSMGHFEMVSKRVSGVEHAEVEQCYLCHQTTSWNDIKSVGTYDHH